ncbi:hypothetical protein Vadar_012009 [Vaccinium darrowii]|uniref:Uncharacterized protein n=1 Tax=Vaccinium darrowii TaxID=229202 RepID=A0ACB7XR30_9ERIC|nr:hypothetical protein Vadar_012009 [Vaccinium darrowii]
MVEIERKLYDARRGSKQNSTFHQNWINRFMDSGSEIEHEAFLVLWLSRHVLPKSFYMVGKHVHGIAIHIARGTRIALAPAVLSRIYRDLRLLKEATGSNREHDLVVLDLWAPMHLFQIWAYERFPTLCPNHNVLELGKPRMARWNEVKKLSIENLRSVLDSAGESFLWRPYAISNQSWLFHKFYKKSEEWVLVHPRMDEELESFARFLRASELVGLDSIEQYLPHRVAMQFGMDQDLPGHVARYNRTLDMAWKNYSRPIGDVKLYIPSRLFESDVTTRYLEWWKQMDFVQKHAAKGVEEGKRIFMIWGRCSRRSSGSSKRKKLVSLKDLEKYAPHSHSPSELLPSKLSLKDFSIPPKSAECVGKDGEKIGEIAGEEVTSHGKSFPCTQPQTSLSLTADNGTDKERKSGIKPRGKAQCDEVSMEELHRSNENAVTEGRARNQADNEVSTKNNEERISATQIPGPADNETDKARKSEIKPRGKARCDEVPMGTLQQSNENAVTDGGARNQADNLVRTIKISSTQMSPEARVAKLEEVFARLKAKKLGLESV